MARTAGINVIAAFRSPSAAKTALKRLTSSGIKRSDVHAVGFESTDRDRRSALRAEMQDEVTEGWAGPGVGALTPDQAKGAFWGVAGGTIVGAVLGAIGGLGWALGADQPMSDLARFLMVFIPAVVAGTVAGAVIGGAMRPRMEAEAHPGKMLDEKRLEAERDTLLSVRVSDEDTAARAQRLLQESGADRVDAVDASGTPLPRESEPEEDSP